MAMLDGDLTATIQPEGLRVGDVIDIALTVHRHDPVFQGHSEDVAAVAGPGVLGRVHLRALWPASKPDAATLDSGGSVQLRLGEFAKSGADYDAALNRRPDRAASLYGRVWPS